MSRRGRFHDTIQGRRPFNQGIISTHRECEYRDTAFFFQDFCDLGRFRDAYRSIDAATEVGSPRS
jgi:hypothetical protein